MPNTFKKISEKVRASIGKNGVASASSRVHLKDAATTQTGNWGEDIALDYLLQQGLRCVERNWRAAGKYGTEVDLIMQDQQTLVFVEVRVRKNTGFGGANASINGRKQQRIVRAAQQYIQRYGGQPPACRFDAVLIHTNTHTHTNPSAKQTREQGEGNAASKAVQLEWIRSAFDASYSRGT